MFAVRSVAMFPFLAMLLMGGGVGLPLGVPPLPEDPVLARIAPEECLAYTSWAGIGHSGRQEQEPDRTVPGRAGDPATVQPDRAGDPRQGRGERPAAAGGDDPRRRSAGARSCSRGRWRRSSPRSASAPRPGRSRRSDGRRGRGRGGLEGRTGEVSGGPASSRGEGRDRRRRPAIASELGPGLPAITWGITGQATCGRSRRRFAGRHPPTGARLAARVADRPAQTIAGRAAVDGDVREREEDRAAVRPAGRAAGSAR